MAANDPEKKMPSTAAKATSRSPNVAFSDWIHFNAQSAFLFTQGTGKQCLKWQIIKNMFRHKFEVSHSSCN